MQKSPEKEIDALYKFVRLKIASGNSESILERLSVVTNIEDKFLHNYTNRKGEGVYYTQKYISDFIVSQTLLEFFLGRGLNETGLDEIKPGNEFILNIIPKIESGI